MSLQARVDGNTIYIDGATDEVVLLFNKVTAVAIVAMEHDDEIDTVTVVTNVAEKD